MSQSNNHNKDKQITKGIFYAVPLLKALLRKNTFREQVQFKTQNKNKKRGIYYAKD